MSSPGPDILIDRVLSWVGWLQKTRVLYDSGLPDINGSLLLAPCPALISLLAL